MRVVFLVTQLESGGAQAATIKLSREFKKRGHQVETWFLYKKREAFHEFENKVCLLDRPPKSMMDYFKIWYRVLKRLSDYRPDALFTFTHYSNVLGQLSAWIIGIERRIASQRNPNYNYPKIVKLLDKIFGSLNIYTQNIMVSKSVNDTFQGYPQSYRVKSKVIYNGIIKNEASVSQEVIKTRYKIDSEDFIFLNVGRLSKQKNQEVIIKAVSEIDNAILIILGEGEERDHLESVINKNSINNVILAGEVSQQEVVNLMSVSDTFLMPSKFEGMSNALLESMSLGVPIIASDIPPNREVLRNDNKEYGILVPFAETQKWKESMQDMVNDPSLKLKFRELSKLRSALFMLESMVNEFEQLID